MTLRELLECEVVGAAGVAPSTIKLVAMALRYRCRTIPELAEVVQIGERQVHRTLAVMMDHGAVDCHVRRGGAKVYRLVDAEALVAL